MTNLIAQKRPLVEQAISALARERTERKLSPPLVTADLMLAVGLVESEYVPGSWNPEPDYRYLVDTRTWKPFRPLTAAENASEKPPGDFRCLMGDPDQEWWAQQASWGNWHCLGAVLRELGYRQPFIPSILVYENWQAFYAVKHMDRMMQRFGFQAGIPCYNHGPGFKGDYKTDGYYLKVMAALGEVRKA